MRDLEFGWTFSVRERFVGTSYFPVSVFARDRGEALFLLEYALKDLEDYEVNLVDVTQLRCDCRV